jgi:hypothetical protein
MKKGGDAVKRTRKGSELKDSNTALTFPGLDKYGKGE